METIFDHNITETEMEYFCRKEIYFNSRDADTAYADIAYLYRYRHNRPMMEKYANKIKDISYKNDFWRTVNHPM